MPHRREAADGESSGTGPERSPSTCHAGILPRGASTVPPAIGSAREGLPELVRDVVTRSSTAVHRWSSRCHSRTVTVEATSAKEQMLHLDCPVPHVEGLALRTHDRLARLFRERLEHTQKVLTRLASRTLPVSRVDSPERRPPPQLRLPDSRTPRSLAGAEPRATGLRSKPDGAARPALAVGRASGPRRSLTAMRGRQRLLCIAVVPDRRNPVLAAGWRAEATG